MKKLPLLAILLIATCTFAMAQPRAIGGRLGPSVGPSYQHQIGERTMIQADVDMLAYAAGIQGTVTFNWIIPLKSWEKVNWNLLAGVGTGGGYEWCGNRIIGWWGYGFVGAAGMVGLEWNFKFPLQLSVEYRPLIGPKFYHENVTGKKNTDTFFYYRGLWQSAVAIGVRYKFGGK
jgi:hypothetical protein